MADLVQCINKTGWINVIDPARTPVDGPQYLNLYTVVRRFTNYGLDVLELAEFSPNAAGSKSWLAEFFVPVQPLGPEEIVISAKDPDGVTVRVFS